ncbi:39S ribosomal protein L54, mitochondrial [Triplophysa rosa]|uniref:Large ribosomal subunit protein mL54 n=1 Tax=Triplophysa rosa TaxID=992332 RepID=A0A9W7T599_TRIRA|nr:39S ribosomal protein L54, mitochondrial [Triplophysa rosa]KAI7790962.1 putative 39S ribosomal protein L54 [Triplophysa rosa]
MALHVLHSFKRLNLTSFNERFVNVLMIQTCGYAKKAATKGKGKGMVKEALKGPDVCKDTVRLCTNAVGVNIFKQGEDPSLKPKEEYPEWLFQLDLGPPRKLNELDPDSWEYWKLLRKEHIWRHNKLHKGKKM